MEVTGAERADDTWRSASQNAKGAPERGSVAIQGSSGRALASMKFTAMATRLTIAGLIALAGIAMFQDRLLYFPEKAAVRDMVSERLRAWPSPQDFRGLVAEPAGAVRGTAIVFHGNAGHAGHRAFYATALTPLGLRVILAEYPGYGPRDGAARRSESGRRRGETIALAHQPVRRAAAAYRRVAWGGGRGCRRLRANATRRRGLLLITPWDRLAHVGAHHYPWLPVKWLLRDHYDTVTHLAAFGRPVWWRSPRGTASCPRASASHSTKRCRIPSNSWCSRLGTQRLGRQRRRHVVAWSDCFSAR